MAVNLLGNPNDFNEINKIIDKREIILLEDNESMGVLFEEKKAGTFGLMGTFSSFSAITYQQWRRLHRNQR